MDIYGLSDRGRVREKNEDTCRYELRDSDGQVIFAVCDGMGGARAGNVASEISCRVFTEHISRYIRRSMSSKYMESIIKNAINFANYETYKASASSAELRGMGTTLVGGFYNNGRIMIANVGDSRAYIYTPEGMRRVTRDHSLVEEMVRRGEITEEQAREHPRKNLITRAMGTDTKVEADLYPLELVSGQKLLLCTDGLTNMLRDEDIHKALKNNNLKQCCEELIEEANMRGGFDNITVLILSPGKETI